MPVSRLACLLALVLAVPTASPGAEPKDGFAWQSILPEDVNGLLVLDWKAFLDSPLVKKGLKGKLPKVATGGMFLPIDPKALGIDPARDVRRVVVVMAHSYWAGPRGADARKSGMAFVLETGKTSAALREKFDAVAKDGMFGAFKALDEAKVRLYEVTAHGYLAVLPGGAVALSPDKDVVLAVVARMKAGGRRLKHDAMARFVKGVDPGAAASGLLLADAAIRGHEAPFKGKTTMHMTLTTLGDFGLRSVRIEARAKDTLKLTVNLECKDKDAAEAKARELEDLINVFKTLSIFQAEKEPRFKPVTRMLDALKITAVGKAVRFEGEADAEVAVALDLLLSPGK